MFSFSFWIIQVPKTFQLQPPYMLIRSYMLIWSCCLTYSCCIFVYAHSAPRPFFSTVLCAETPQTVFPRLSCQLTSYWAVKRKVKGQERRKKHSFQFLSSGQHCPSVPLLVQPSTLPLSPNRALAVSLQQPPGGSLWEVQLTTNGKISKRVKCKAGSKINMVLQWHLVDTVIIALTHLKSSIRSTKIVGTLVLKKQTNQKTRFS